MALVIVPIPGRPIEIRDLNTGQMWTVVYYIRKNGVPSLAFEAPQNIRISHRSRSGKNAPDKG